MSVPGTPASEALRSEALRTSMARIEDILDEENTRLARSVAPDLTDFNDRKARALLQFDRAVRGIDVDEARRTLGDQLDALRERLEENRRLLEMHRDAARRVTGILAEAMMAGESDGTYARYPQTKLFGA